MYVLNKSDPRGNINLVVRDMSGRNVGLQIPITFIPVDLSTFCVKQDVLRTPDFRRLWAKGFIHIVETKSAEEMLKDPKAQEEYRRIYEVLNDDRDLTFQAPVEESINAEPPKTEKPINTFIQNIVLRAANEPTKMLIAELEGKLDTFSEADIAYLKENTTNAPLRSWCDEALNIMGS